MAYVWSGYAVAIGDPVAVTLPGTASGWGVDIASCVDPRTLLPTLEAGQEYRHATTAMYAKVALVGSTWPLAWWVGLYHADHTTAATIYPIELGFSNPAAQVGAAGMPNYAMTPVGTSDRSTIIGPGPDVIAQEAGQSALTIFHDDRIQTTNDQFFGADFTGLKWAAGKGAGTTADVGLTTRLVTVASVYTDDSGGGGGGGGGTFAVGNVQVAGKECTVLYLNIGAGTAADGGDCTRVLYMYDAAGLRHPLPGFPIVLPDPGGPLLAYEVDLPQSAHMYYGRVLYYDALGNSGTVSFNAATGGKVPLYAPADCTRTDTYADAAAARSEVWL